MSRTLSRHPSRSWRSSAAGRPASPLILAIGPTLDQVVEASGDLLATIAYSSTALPFPAAELRTVADGSDVVLVEPYLAGTSSAALADALRDQPPAAARARRAAARAAPLRELPRSTAVPGLDASGIRRSLDAFLAGDARAARTAAT